MTRWKLYEKLAFVLEESPLTPLTQANRSAEGKVGMCLTCGCLLPHEDHGKAGYLTIEDLEKSAEIDGYTLDEAVQNLVKTVEVAKNERSTNTNNRLIPTDGPQQSRANGSKKRGAKCRPTPRW